jgi:hypothetical protein
MLLIGMRIFLAVNVCNNKRFYMKEKSVSFFLFIFLFSSAIQKTSLQASQQEQDSLTFIIVGSSKGFTRRFGEISSY